MYTLDAKVKFHCLTPAQGEARIVRLGELEPRSWRAREHEPTVYRGSGAELESGQIKWPGSNWPSDPMTRPDLNEMNMQIQP